MQGSDLFVVPHGPWIMLS